MIHVICLKHGDKYDSRYVDKLYNMVLRNTRRKLGRDFTFTCYTDSRVGIDPAIRWIELPRKDLMGWWHKLWFFSPEFIITIGPGQVLYLDLDTVIVGNIDEYMDYTSTQAPLAILRDMGTRNNQPPASVNWGSAIMSWPVGWGQEIWKEFTRDVGQQMRGHGHGDQGYIKYVVKPKDVALWQDILTGNSKVISYKWDIRDPNQGTPDPPVPPGTSIVCFHGRPWPHEVTNLLWMQQHWK
jgi:hypothetical protein